MCRSSSPFPNALPGGDVASRDAIARPFVAGTGVVHLDDGLVVPAVLGLAVGGEGPHLVAFDEAVAVADEAENDVLHVVCHI